MRVAGGVMTCAVALLWSALALGGSEQPRRGCRDEGRPKKRRHAAPQRADVNAPQADGATALHWAVYRDDLPLVERLLAAGARVNAANRLRRDPTRTRLRSTGARRTIARLLAAGANPNERGPNGETALMMASRTGAVDAMTALLDRRRRRQRDRNAARNHGVNVGRRAHHLAAVKLLLDRGADVALRSKPAALARTAYLAPSARQRASQLVNENGERRTRPGGS